MPDTVAITSSLIDSINRNIQGQHITCVINCYVRMLQVSMATDRWLFFSIFMFFRKCHIFHCASSNGVVSRRLQTCVAALLLRIRSPCFVSLVTDLRAAIPQSIGRFAKSGDRILVEAKFSAPVQSGRGPPVQWVLVHFPGVKRSGRGVDHQPHPEPRLKKE